MKDSVKWFRFGVAGIFFFLLILLSAAYVLFYPNVVCSGEETVLYLSERPESGSFQEQLQQNDVFKNSTTLNWVYAFASGYRQQRPGKFNIGCNSGNFEVVRLLLSGRKSPVRITLSGRLRLEEICGYMQKNLDVDSAVLYSFVRDSSDAGGEKGLCRFLADTYEFDWDVTEREVWSRFSKEYDLFWNAARLAKCSELNLSPEEVIILASIADGEVKHDEELPRVAGVYLNRLNRGWRLDADPTIQYLVREQGRQRILNEDRRIESPYNTYLNAGLPPGPIFIPRKEAINAVLYAEKHSFMFFCARSDFSGYHYFVRTLPEHNRNAAKYHRALDAAGIRR